MSETKHTPTPWRVFMDGKSLLGIGEETGEGITDLGLWRMGDETTANAAHIVRAVNSHDALVDALARGAALVSGDLVGIEWKKACREFLLDATSALALAGSGQ